MLLLVPRELRGKKIERVVVKPYRDGFNNGRFGSRVKVVEFRRLTPFN